MTIAGFIFDYFKFISLIIKNEKAPDKKIKLILDYSKITLKYLFLEKIFKIKIKNERVQDYRIEFFDYGSFRCLFNEIFILKEYDLNLSKKPYIIDCGSNFGLSILFFKKEIPDCRILSFEPDKKAFDILKKNIKNNNLNSVNLINAAVSDKNGKIEFYTDAEIEGSLSSSIDNRLLEDNKKFIKNFVKSVKLSEYISNNVDLLKMDVEGAEERILQDLFKSKKIRFLKEIICEYHFNINNKRNDLNNILNILKKSNFKYTINSSKNPPYYNYKNKKYNLTVYAYKK